MTEFSRRPVATQKLAYLSPTDYKTLSNNPYARDVYLKMGVCPFSGTTNPIYWDIAGKKLWSLKKINENIDRFNKNMETGNVEGIYPVQRCGYGMGGFGRGGFGRGGYGMGGYGRGGYVYMAGIDNDESFNIPNDSQYELFIDSDDGI